MRGSKRALMHVMTFQVLLSLIVFPAVVSSRAKATRRDAPLQLPADETPTFQVREIQIRGNTLLSERELLAKLPGVYEHVIEQKDRARRSEVYDFRVLREITAEPGPPRGISQRTMEGFTRYVLSEYQRRGFAGIYVYVSAETVEGQARLVDDILRIRVIESRVAHVDIDRRSFESGDPNQVQDRVNMFDYRFWLPGLGPVRREYTGLRDVVLRAWSPAKPGQVVPQKELEQFIAMLNTNPDRHASAVISASDEPNAVDLAYEIYEADPWHFYAQVDNAGTEERQWSPRLGMVNTNVSGRDDRLSLMYQTVVEAPDENYAAFGNYDFPFLMPRLRLGFYAGYSRFDISTEATGGITSFLGDGSFFGTTLRYNVAKIDDWLFDLTGSVSNEESRVQPSLGQSSDVDLRLFGVGFQLHRSSEMSQTLFSFERLQNYDGSGADAFGQARIGADPDFIKYSASAQHRQFLDADKVHEVRARLMGIASNERLVPAKMTAFGGLYTVRGYEEDEIVADGGLLASLEYRSDLTKSLHSEQDGGNGKNTRPSPVEVALLAFTDYGRPVINDPVPGEFDAQDMWGIGLGTVVEIGARFQAGIYHSWALRQTQRGDGSLMTDKGDSQWNFNFIYRW